MRGVPKLFRELEGDGVKLRPLSEDDLEKTRHWRNLQRIRKWFRDSSRVTPEQHADFWKVYCERNSAQTDFTFVIYAQHLQRIVGQVAICNYNRDLGIAELVRCMIGDGEAVGCGVMKAAIERLVKWCRDELNLLRLHLFVKIDNSRAIGLYESLGFSECSRKEDGIYMEKLL